jgi:hypothetical protein
VGSTPGAGLSCISPTAGHDSQARTTVATYLLVLDNLGDEVALVQQVCHNGHAHPQGQHIGVLLEQALHHRLNEPLLPEQFRSACTAVMHTYRDNHLISVSHSAARDACTRSVE